MTLATFTTGCPYMGPIDPIEPGASIAPEIYAFGPQEQTKTYIKGVDSQVFFWILVSDLDSEDSDLTFTWLRNDQITLTGTIHNGYTQYPLSIASASIGEHITLRIQVADEESNQDEHYWDITIQ